MNIVAELQERFRPAVATLVEDPTAYLALIRPTQNAKFGDYQMNCAMPLERELGRPAVEIATQLMRDVRVSDLCEFMGVAGKGFINLTLRTAWIEQQLELARRDPRLGVAPVARPRTIVVDYSSPNVAKSMHVGHIRSTVIGDAIARMLHFRGHRVIRDNHLGDWGTQFGMILYGFQNFVDRARYEQDAVGELTRLYQVVRSLMDYQATRVALPERRQACQLQQEELARVKTSRSPADLTDKQALKKLDKEIRKLEAQCRELQTECEAMASQIAEREASPSFMAQATAHPDVGEAVLRETALLHAGDPDRRARWEEFVPQCREAIQRIYDRLQIEFDLELGESFYHARLAGVVDDLRQRGLITESDGALCVFLPEFDAPMIVQKRDGAYLYATTDLATIHYRMEMWQPDEILYVVDFRQAEHFEKLFAVAKHWGYDQLELRHVKFGTVLSPQGTPFKTRAGDAAGLEELLDQAVAEALRVVGENDRQKPTGPEFSPEQRAQIAEVVGHAAIKYADLSQNRESDYVYQQEKMVAMKGNTATYMQYSYARIQNIFAKGGIDVPSLREKSDAEIRLIQPVERQLGLRILKFEQTLDDALEDYRPHLMTEYLFELAKEFSDFYTNCPVLRAEDDAERESRLLLCDLVGRTIRQGLELLGIAVVDKM